MATRTLFLAIFLVGASPIAAEAQWASSRIEHDWRLTLGNDSFGLVQTAVYMTDLEHVNHRTTTIYAGPLFTVTTHRFRATQIATVFLLLAGAGGAFVVRRASQERAEP